MDDSIESVRNEFFQEAKEILERATTQMLKIEATEDVAVRGILLNGVFREIHTVKGGAGMFEMEDVSGFAHQLESVLNALREGNLMLDSDLVDTILEGVDHLTAMLRDYASGRQASVSDNLLNRFSEALNKEKKRKEKSVGRVDQFQEIPSFQQLPDPEILRVFSIEALQYIEDIDKCLREVEKENTVESLKPLQKILELLQEQCVSLEIPVITQVVIKFNQVIDGQLSKKIGFLPEQVSEFKEISSYFEECVFQLIRNEMPELKVSVVKVLDFLLSSVEPQESVNYRRLGEILVDEGKITQDDIIDALEKQGESESPDQKSLVVEKEAKTIRISEDKIEFFSNIIGELLISRNTYDYIMQQWQLIGASQDIYKHLKENLYQVTRLTNEIHHGITALRMIPIKGVFQRFNRIVRDISRRQQKHITLITEGGEIEIDKSVADKLFDPLVHLVRNACDHGIEMPEKRMLCNKGGDGTVWLSAYQEGSFIRICVKDNGKGINRDRLFEKAKTLGCSYTSSDDPNLLDVIFMPGFSTNTEITEISGRGVGMDVVKTTVESLNGTVGVQSEAGQGTEINLSIPTNMGIITALIIEQSNEPYAIPLDSIVEIIKVNGKEFHCSAGKLFISYRQEIVSVHYLSYCLGFDSSMDILQNQHGLLDMPLVILKTRRAKFGLLVDHVDRQMEIAIKPLPETMKDIDIVNGVSIRGDGKVFFVLNPEKLME
ncbi:MAG: chemotaxis protein CheA [Desulfobacterales bacterium]|nr:chemotaxis protein CheA [Desulfobacterales bacterium]